VQTGFGAFVSVYLTTEKWTQTDIGLVLTVGAFVGLVGQIPGGAIVDAARSQRWVAAAAVAAVGISAFALAVSPIFVVVFASRILQAGASCVLGPAIAAISLGLVGQRGISARLGRNAAFASVGSGFAAAGMGAFAYYVSVRAAFILAASMAVPALFALYQIRRKKLIPQERTAASQNLGRGTP
jgi:MFS family permease